MAPPAYGDLGRSARDLFHKHYHFQKIQLDFSSRTPAGVEFSVNGSNNIDIGKTALSLETKYNIKSHGVSIKHRWSTDNILFSEATAEDYLAKGLKAGIATTFAPQTGKRTGKLTCAYKSLFLNLNSNVDLDHAGPVFNGSGVVGHNSLLAGMQVSFDPMKNKLTKSNFALGYQSPAVHVTGHLDDGQEYNCSVVHKLNSDTDVGAGISYSPNSSASKINLGWHHRLDKDTAVKLKVNNSSNVAFAFIHRLRPGLNVTLGAMIDVNSFSQGPHKFGVGFDIEA